MKPYVLYVTNSAGDSIHVIDPATNKVVQEIKGIEAAHGIAPSPDGARVYVSNEAIPRSTCSTARAAPSSRKCR
jgi:YVTN family beta-propeller protein